MLKHIRFLMSCSLKDGYAGIDQKRHRLGLRDSSTRSVTPRAALPRGARFAAAYAGVLQP